MPLELLPTPTVNDATNSSIPPSQIKRDNPAGAYLRGLLPTPRASKITGGDMADFSPSLPGLLRRNMLPTPKANDFRSGMSNRVGTEHTQQLNDTVAYLTGQTSQLNPLFAAEMMGFPVDWTVLPFLAGCGNRLKPTETP